MNDHPVINRMSVKAHMQNKNPKTEIKTIPTEICAILLAVENGIACATVL